MIRHKATGTELAWRPTWDGDGFALSSAHDSVTPVYVYPGSVCGGSVIYAHSPGDDFLYGSVGSETKESMLAKAVELGVVEIIPDEPPASEEKDYDAVHRAGEAEQRSIYVEALAAVAAHEWSTVEFRSAAICELRRLALEDR